MGTAAGVAAVAGAAVLAVAVGTDAVVAVAVVVPGSGSAAGFFRKHLVADLLDVADPDNLAGFGPVFRFPFQTIESVIPLGERRVGVLNDNNYPFSAGRVPGQSDPNEFIIIRLDRPLASVIKHDDRGPGRRDR